MEVETTNLPRGITRFGWSGIAAMWLCSDESIDEKIGAPDGNVIRYRHGKRGDPNSKRGDSVDGLVLVSMAVGRDTVLDSAPESLTATGLVEVESIPSPTPRSVGAVGTFAAIAAAAISCSNLFFRRASFATISDLQVGHVCC